jgi:hypothetical protein
LIRDVLSFLGGWALIFMEVQRTELRESVLILAAGIVGVPSAAVGAQALVDALAARRTGTGESSSSPQAGAASPSAGSSS